MSAGCTTCGKQLGPRNTSGLCRACIARRLSQDPETRARQRAGIQAMHADPVIKAGYAERARQMNKNISPERRERLREHGRRMQREVLSRPDVVARVTSKDARRRAGAARTASTMAWCPVEYWPMYRNLVDGNHAKAREARAMVLEQVALDERKRVAALTPEQRQMERLIKAGGRLIEVHPIRRSEPTITLGGVPSGQL